MTSPVSAIEAIEKAMEGVTPGPWHVAESGLGNKVKAPTVYHAGDDLNYVASFADFMTFHGPTRNLENARYIAACNPVAMREVLALARQAEALTGIGSAHDLISDWLGEGTDDLPDDTPVRIEIGKRTIIADNLGSLRRARTLLKEEANAGN